MDSWLNHKDLDQDGSEKKKKLVEMKITFERN